MSLLKLRPATKDYIWGGHRLIEEFSKESTSKNLAETWELSCHKDGLSYIENGEFRGKSLKEYIETKGALVLGENSKRFKDFPILIKFIDAADNLSIQVHPSDEYAIENESQYGKTEMWYIVDALEGSFVYYGFNKRLSKEEFKQAIENNTLLEYLKKVYVKKGDVLFIESGIIHAIGKGVLIAEIQQNSNLTYRVYDFNRRGKDGKTRELHIDKAIEVINREPISLANNAYPHLATCKYFTVDKLYMDGKSIFEMEGFVSADSFLSLLFLDGKGRISLGELSMEYKKGDSFFISAASGKYKISGACELLLTRI